MTTVHLAHADYPSTHAGAERIVNAGETLQVIGQRARKQGTLASLLLAAMLAALVVVAEQVLSQLEDGHLLLSWMALWLVVFAGLALFAGTARRVALRFRQSWQGFVARQAQARSDERFLETALRDERVMKELIAAATRQRD
jgi:hypothetical protein